MNATAPYIVGIDLGTTNSALSYVDRTTAAAHAQCEVRTLPIPQLTAPGEIKALPVLPSFVYLPEASDEDFELLRLPWQGTVAGTSPCPDPPVVTGTYARERATEVPSKVVASAKSWLCVESVDRHSPVLPYDRNPVPRQLSPVRAVCHILEHLRDAWNHAFADSNDRLSLAQQEVYLTVPASFDAVARQLTVEAAKQAGLAVKLLEEPQAAFYAWLQAQGEEWRREVSPGDRILVCDIGGGTTDFSLIAVQDRDGDLELQRIAVGEHILLGGDNMDLTLAYGMAAKIEEQQGISLEPHQVTALTHACRAAKEKIGAGEPGPHSLTILGRGTGVIAGTVTTELTETELDTLLLQGFFPACSLSEKAAAKRRVGLRSFGLDYASDPALTRHLAGFLNSHSVEDAAGRLATLPTAILFNGGVTGAPVFTSRIMSTLNSWKENPDAPPVRVLERHDPDLSVSIGAAWYGTIQRTGGVRIKGGSARSYYIGVESALPAVPGFEPPMEALCVVHFGLEPGTPVEVDAAGLGLIVGEQTEFRFFTSTSRPDDNVGDRIRSWGAEELRELPPLIAELPAEDTGKAAIGSLIPVTLHSELSEVGTLQLWCRSLRDSNEWKLEFELDEERTGKNQ